MKNISSNWKMREVMPLETPKGVKKREAVFTKGETTELEDADYKFLMDTHKGFKFCIENGLFNVVGASEVSPPAADDIEAKISKIKADAEVNKQKVIDSSIKKLERKNANKEKIESDKQSALTSIQEAADQKIAKLKGE